MSQDPKKPVFAVTTSHGPGSFLGRCNKVRQASVKESLENFTRRGRWYQVLTLPVVVLAQVIWNKVDFLINAVGLQPWYAAVLNGGAFDQPAADSLPGPAAPVPTVPPVPTEVRPVQPLRVLKL